MEMREDNEGGSFERTADLDLHKPYINRIIKETRLRLASFAHICPCLLLPPVRPDRYSLRYYHHPNYRQTFIFGARRGGPIHVFA